MQRQIEVRGVGIFALKEGDGYHHYVCERPGSGRDPLLIVIYPDDDTVSASYADRIRAIVTKVASGSRQMIGRAETLVRELMDRYGLDTPEEFSSLVDAQHLTHIKVGEDWAELIFDTCPFFPSFDLNVTLDGDAEIAKVWFDG